MSTTLAPRSISQRGKARPKTSRASSNMEPSLDRFNTRLYTFEQTLGETTVSQVGTVPVLLGGTSLSILSPTFSILDQSSTYVALFDQYRIVEINWRFRPQFSGINFSTTDNVPLLYTVIDYDDNTNPASLAALREYQNCQTHMYESFNMRCVPHCANSLYSGAFTSYGNMTSPWIDLNSVGVLHYGLKLGITAGNVGQTNLQRWYVTCTLTVQCKNVR